MKRTISVSIATLALIPGVSFAAPAVTNVSGALAHGSAVTVSGSGFGAGDAAPLLFDDFETGTNGGSLPGSPRIGTWSLSNGGPTYTTATAHAGNLSALSDYPGGNGFKNILWEPMSHATGATYYQSYWFRYDSPTDDDCGASYHCGQTKLTQVWGSYRVGDYNPGVMTGGAAADWWVSYLALEDGSDLGTRVTYPDTPSRNTWHQFEMFLKQSDANTQNGRVTILIDGAAVYDRNPTHTRTIAGEGWDFTTFFDGMTNWGAPVQTWVDDVYFNDSWAHVVLGDASTYTASTIREIQIPSSWSDTALTLTTNLGQFTTGTAYLYVVDSTGAVNEAGYPVTVGGTPDTTPPASPTGLAIQ